ncbi:hypothetical protein OGAPHI_002949 [Ogataea philodendri]|uniref:Uncharacterized protein n=1 Tax=Ogataea philodendri TaxID=1378263 RepID=A0A9P8P957_9ASCO|nr:uncharacterized protein OGAPHI_002949 [Ogataea philodendri]KAH3667300.1 hypothetical protein OGAPHI_002949 [Ogataea philodendri]
MLRETRQDGEKWAISKMGIFVLFGRSYYVHYIIVSPEAYFNQFLVKCLGVLVGKEGLDLVVMLLLGEPANGDRDNSTKQWQRSWNKLDDLVPVGGQKVEHFLDTNSATRHSHHWNPNILFSHGTVQNKA